MPPTRSPDEHQIEQRRAVGLRIRALRNQRGLSLEKLGELAGGYNRQTIGAYENGAAPATIDALVGIARALGVEPWRLFYG